MSRFDAARDVLRHAIAARAFPAAMVEVGNAWQPLWREPLGTLTYDGGSSAVRDDTIFDLASLTKVIATASLVLREVERGAFGLDDVASKHLAGWGQGARAAVTIGDLLAHCSGLPAYVPFYQEHRGRTAFETAISAVPLEYPPRTRSVYSDLGFMLLGFALDAGVPLRARFDTLWAQVAPGEELQFTPPDTWRWRTAPTEDDPWRGRRLIGEVHDENAAALGGVAGHAGLFGTAPAVGAFARHVLQVLDGRSGAFSRDGLVRFVTRGDVPGTSRALGWDTMLPTSSCGSRMSARAFGHTGFTGTSLWIDPEAGVYVVLLTNRVHPTRQNDAIQQVRPAFHDAVMAAL